MEILSAKKKKSFSVWKIKADIYMLFISHNSYASKVITYITVKIIKISQYFEDRNMGELALFSCEMQLSFSFS